jgi:hypothetical protein
MGGGPEVSLPRPAPPVHPSTRGPGRKTDKGGRSTNLDNDVYGHIQNAHLQPYIKHGIYGYACRAKRNSNEWSTHAFGIAIDVSSAEEYLGKCTSTVNRNHASIWQNHGWYWGLAFCDPMHFQYATNY